MITLAAYMLIVGVVMLAALLIAVGFQMLRARVLGAAAVMRALNRENAERLYPRLKS